MGAPVPGWNHCSPVVRWREPSAFEACLIVRLPGRHETTGCSPWRTISMGDIPPSRVDESGESRPVRVECQTLGLAQVRSFSALILVASFLYATTYLFIKVAVEEIPPATLVATRLLLAAPVFVILLATAIGPRLAVATVGREWRTGVILGAASFAVPITLIAYGERWVSSGIAAVGIAATPIFVQLLARRF